MVRSMQNSRQTQYSPLPPRPQTGNCARYTIGARTKQQNDVCEVCRTEYYVEFSRWWVSRHHGIKTRKGVVVGSRLGSPVSKKNSTYTHCQPERAFCAKNLCTPRLVAEIFRAKDALRMTVVFVSLCERSRWLEQ